MFVYRLQKGLYTTYIKMQKIEVLSAWQCCNSVIRKKERSKRVITIMIILGETKKLTKPDQRTKPELGPSNSKMDQRNGPYPVRLLAFSSTDLTMCISAMGPVGPENSQAFGHII